MTLRPRIVTSPDVVMGKPVVEGTRVTVELILKRLGEGRSVGDILAEYPQLTREQVKAAIDWIANQEPERGAPWPRKEIEFQIKDRRRQIEYCERQLSVLRSELAAYEDALDYLTKRK